MSARATLAVVAALAAAGAWSARSGDPVAARVHGGEDGGPAPLRTAEHASAPAPAVAQASRTTEPRRPASAVTAPAGRPTTVRVVVQLAGQPTGQAGGLSVPEPELLRIDRFGHPWPVKARAGSGPARAADEPTTRRRVKSFEVDGPGRYVAAWHLWRPVPGTVTWRVCRGRGPAIDVGLEGGTREVVVSVDAARLVLDPRLDVRMPGARTTLTAKDGSWSPER